MNFTNIEVEFTKSGAVFNAAQVDDVLQAADSLTDLFVASHGWNNDVAEARQLYDQLFSNMSALLDANVVRGLDGRTFGVMRLLWPSKKFADEDLIPGGGAASATSENDSVLENQLEELKLDPQRLEGRDTDPARESALTQAQSIISRLQADPGARREFVSLLRSIPDPREAHPDDGSDEFFTLDAEELFHRLSKPVSAPGPAPNLGGATDVRRADGAANIGDLLDGVKAAARRIANFTTYLTMKERSGVVGHNGLAPVLQRLRERKNSVRLHLIGHSFGGRLVTSAANALQSDSPAVTLSLLQAAYSHNGLARNFDQKGHDGAFRDVLSGRRVSGPIIITHTKNDRAVGIAYPLASRLSRDVASALGDANDPYGGMGRNGAQHTTEASGRNGELQEVGGEYKFSPGSVFNLRADNFIHGHGDVTGPEVAYAILNAAAAV
jgi:hypothetical protein